MESNEESEYRHKLGLCAQSLADKMAILEARDRLMRMKRLRHRQTDLATAVAVVGTCPDMCPELERYFRQETNQVSLFEMDSNTGRPDEYRMVKEYRRSGADQEEPLPHELRPTPVLITTMDYLCTNIMDTLDVNTGCGEWYDFVWSRTRSIRKDITQQHLCDRQVVELTEKCARFHIHCSATLCEQNVKDFDPKINEENLSNCLQSLKDLYYDLSLRDIHCPNESEFRCYEILLHLNDTAILKDVHNYRKQIRESSAVRIAIKAFFAFQSNNYIKFFKVLDNCSYLMSCILHRYFTPIRQKAMKIMRKCYTSNSSSAQDFPENTLISCLGFEDSHELKAFCDHIGIEHTHGFVHLMRGQNQNNALKAKRSVRLVESKRSVSVGQVINGSPLPPNPYKAVAVHNSFNFEGKLTTDAFEAMDQRTKTLNCDKSSVPNVEDLNTSIASHKTVMSSFVSPHNTSNAFNVKTTSNEIFAQKKPSLHILNQLFDSFETIYENIAENIVNEVVESEVMDIASKQLKNVFNQMLEQIICHIFSDIFLKTLDQMIKEISIEVIQKEMDLKVEELKVVNQMSAEFFDSFIISQIKCISTEVFIQLKEESIENSLIANQLLDVIINEMVEEMASEVLSYEINRRDETIREKRTKTLQKKYFLKWKEWSQRRRRLKYLSESLPAAPKWLSSPKSSPKQILYSFSDLSFGEQFSESIERQLLTNNLLNFLIDSVIKEVICEVFQSSVSQKIQFFDYFKQKRLKRIQSKYFTKWRQICCQKRQDIKRNSFPAAPNWSSNNCSNLKTKHSFSCLEADNQISAKRLKSKPSDGSTPKSNKLVSNSVIDIKPLFENELSNSRQFTQTLTQQINCHKNIPQMDENIQISDEEEVEKDVEVIQVFESESDKMDRLKRLLEEEADYFSLNTFIHYLKDNN